MLLNSNVPNKGSFEKVKFRDVMFYILMNKKSVILKAQKGKLKVMLYFFKGKPVYARTNRLSDTLGQLILKTGKITEENLDKLLKKHVKENVKLGSIIINEGILTASELKKFLTRQIVNKFSELCCWSEGKYLIEYKTEEELKKEIEFIPVPVSTIILYGAVNNPFLQEEIDSVINKINVGKMVLKDNPKEILKKHDMVNKIILEIIEEMPVSQRINLNELYGKYGKDIVIKVIMILYCLDLLKENEGEHVETVKEDKNLKSDRFGSEIIDDPELYKEYLRMKNISYYELLGIKKSASSREIKKAYFKLAKEYHPDKFYDKEKKRSKREAGLIFSLFNEAFQVLRDVDSRKDYDVFLETGKTKEDFAKEAEETMKVEMDFEKAKVLLKQKKIKESRDIFEDINNKVNDIEFQIYYAWTDFLYNYLNKNKEWEKGLKLLRNICGDKKMDKNLYAHLFYAKALKATGKEDEAIKEYRKVLVIDPYNSESKSEIALYEKRRR